MITVVTRARGCVAICVVAAASVVAGGPAHAQAPPRPLDLSAYNCAAIDPGKTAEVRHMGQVIKSRYHEWHEFYVNANGKRMLACISQLAPQAHQLTADEAKSFLSDSVAIGTPGAGQSTNSSQGVVEPQDVKPEPRKHRLGQLPAGTAEQPQSQQKKLPPVPATKLAPDGTQQGASIAPERAQTTQETPATVGVEDRVAVPATSAFPYNTIGYLSVTYPDGESFRCSGTLVSPYVVLTAGHCVHNNNRGGYVAQVRFYPGQTQMNPGDGVPLRPFGAKSDFAAVQTTQAWTQISGNDSYPVTDYRVDFAAVEFKTPFTFTTTFMPVLYDSTSGSVTNSGYPAVVNNVNMLGQWMDSGAETSAGKQLETFDVREFAIDGSGGDSGSPFFYSDTNGRQALVGSLSYAEDTNDDAGGPWYDGWNQALLSSWVSWTPSTATSGVVTGLHVGNIFSTAQATSQSYLRFYNSGSTAGSVSVTLADPASGAALATWTSPSIQSGSELQFFIKDIEAGASQTFVKPPFYSVSIQPTFTGYLQHVLWQRVDNSLTNLTSCDTAAVADPKVLVGVHSSLLQSGYPSTVVIYNTGTAATAISLGIYDARDGSRISTYTTSSLAANAQQMLSMAAMEAAATPPIAPSGTMYHYVIRSDTSFTGYLQHVVNNTADGVVTDMTNVCRLSP